VTALPQRRIEKIFESMIIRAMEFLRFNLRIDPNPVVPPKAIEFLFSGSNFFANIRDASSHRADDLRPGSS
jgi:hypothetical protein